MDGSSLTRLSDRVLWARIRGAHLPVERDGRGFHEHIAELAEISPLQGRAVEREYRRFLYVAAVSGRGLVPPALVRVAWSYHASLDGYDEDFCRWILGRTLKPGPAAGDEPGYALTWQAYRAEFGVVPPATVWPEPELQVVSQPPIPPHPVRSRVAGSIPSWA